MLSKKNLWLAALVLLTTGFLVPFFSQASEEAVTTEAENVIISEQDAPLVRQAKLKQAWVIYREVGSQDIYALTKNKTKRAIKTLDFFTAYNANYHLKVVAKDRLTAYATAEPINSETILNPEDFIKAGWHWRLIKAQGDPAVYLLAPDGTKKPILAEGVFHRFGWEFRDVEELTKEAVAALPTGTTITDNTLFDEEIIVSSTNQRLEKETLQKRLELKGKTQVKTRLIKAIGDNKVYVMDGQGNKHLVTNEKAAQKFKLNFKNITEVTAQELKALPLGGQINETTTSVNLEQIIK
ncbi:hypothetical protein KKC17_01810 [Patescibacteria group bacterium]|nr:hypothetical protein [Patescibacteria group bacterium]